MWYLQAAVGRASHLISTTAINLKSNVHSFGGGGVEGGKGRVAAKVGMEFEEVVGGGGGGFAVLTDDC